MRRAFTFIELMIVVALMGIIAVIVLPNASADGAIRLVTSVNILAADIEYAQSLSLTEPGDPALVRFDEKNSLHWIAHASTPNTPITRTNGEPYEVTFGMAEDAMLRGVTLDLVDEENDIAFDEFGRLTQIGDRTVRLTSIISGTMRVIVASATGSVFLEPDDE